MLLERILLKNFKRFREQEIRFRDGITGIVGNNGTGKSSIVEGILFALFGLSGTGIRGDFVVSSFAEPRERCEVQLDFLIHGQMYSVRRSFRKGASTQHEARLNRGEKLLAQGVSDVDREIVRILGMNATDLQHTIYAGQKDLVALLESRTGERKQWFSQVLGIDYLKDESLALLKEQIEQAEDREKHREGERAILMQQLAGEDPVLLESAREETEKIISRTMEAAEALKDAIQTSEARLYTQQQMSSRYVRLSERNDAVSRGLEGIGLRRQSIEAQISSLSGEAAAYDEARRDAEMYLQERERYLQEQKKKERFAHLMQERSFARRRRTDLEKRQVRLQEEKRVHEDDLRQHTALIQDTRTRSGCPKEVPDDSVRLWIQEQIQSLAGRSGSLNGILEACGQERERILQDWGQIREAGQDGLCPLCRQRLGEHYPLLESEFEEKLQEIVGRAEHACELLEIQEAEKSRLSSLASTLRSARSADDLHRTAVGLSQRHQDLEQEKTAVIREEDQLDQQIRELAFDPEAFGSLEHWIKEAAIRYDQFQEMGRHLANLPVLRQQREAILHEEEEARSELAGIQQQLKEAAFDPLATKKLEQSLAEQRKEYIGKEAELARNQERLATIREKIKRLGDVQEQIRTAGLQIDANREEIRMLKLTRSMISDFVVYLMQMIRGQIEQTAGEVLSTITDGRYDRVLLDSDFNLRISDMDNDYPLERYSGGEQDDIAVALRIALSRYLAELHQIHDRTFLIFDEIFGSQDEERRTNLLRALRTQEAYFPQIILISHIPEIQGEFSSTLVVEMENDQTSVVQEAS